MKIDRMHFYRVSLPFSGDFSISRLQGLSADTVVAQVVADDGEIIGFGEGRPVEFVTGETPESVVQDLRTFSQDNGLPREIQDVSQIWNFVDGLPAGMEHNAAICAMELALLDALARMQRRAVIDYLPQEHRTDKVHYGAAITLGTIERVREISLLIQKLGISHLRIKLGKDYEQNRDAIQTVAEVFDGDCDLRIDPNGVWDYDLALKHLPLIERYGVKVVEEPMPKEDPGFVKFVDMLRSRGVILMACETAPTLPAVETIIREGYYDLVNVKLSRSGGFRRSMQIIDHLRNAGVPYQIGCTVGESGLLSAGGRILCLLSEDARYCDGSYDKFVLKENVTVEDVSFGPGGEAGPLEGPGLGVVVDGDRLKRLSYATETVAFS